MVDREPVNRAGSSQRAPGFLSELRARMRPHALLALAIAMSLAAHVGFAVFVGRTFETPELDIAFQVPIDVELGMTEEVAAAPVPEPTPAIEPPAQEPAANKKPKREAASDAGVDAGGDEEAGTLADAQVDGGAGASDAGPPADPLMVADAGPVGARLPPGAQIALRVDMARIRESPVADDVRALVTAIPDWKALLDGSGIDPVTQLERLLIMTPNLQREKVALAGRYVGGRTVVDAAVRALAEARGVPAPWQTKRGIAIAPWANADPTPRVIALVGPTHFTISREQDLERVLAIAAARARKGRAKSEQPAGDVADGLLAMEADEGLSLEVEGVEQFVRIGQRGVPLRLRASAIQQGAAGLVLHATFAYADDAAAADALEYWQRRREKWLGNLLIAAAGLSGPLRDARLQQEGSDLQITLSLTVEQTRLVLGYLRSMFPASAP